MHLYQGSTNSFIADATRGLIAGAIADRFFDQYRFRPSQSEIHAWQNSLAAMAHALKLASLDEQGILVELQLPLTSKRLDCLITGHSNGRPSSAIIELKQWDWVGSSPVDECVVTSLGGRDRDVLHPSIQVSTYEQYLLDTHPAFASGDVDVASCAYLHNLPSAKADALLREPFAKVVDRYPVFPSDEIDLLADHLVRLVGEPDDGEVLEKVAAAGFRPQKRLLDHAATMIRNEPVFVLLDEQRIAFNSILAAVEAARSRGERSACLVRGGPGTGKSVIAVNLLAELASKGATVVHATGSLAFTENLRRSVGKRASALFSYFRNLATQTEPLDAVILDEAHRIRTVSTSRFTPAAARTGKAQIEEIFDAARVAIFFIDDLQVVRPGEVGTSDLIRETAAKRGMPVHEFELEAQFRANGSDAFVQWVDNTLGVRRTPQVLWEATDPFDFRIVESPEELEALIRARASEGRTARLTAGFCWPWSEPRPDGTLESDVKIGEWEMPWNARSEAARLAPGIPKSHYWASDPGGINQVGCVYTAQGFEYEYAGVIFGDDLVYRPGRGWIGQREMSKDSTVRRAGAYDRDFTEYARNTYRVLLTRGLRGCYVYFTDPQTRDYFLSRVDIPPSRSTARAAEARVPYGSEGAE